VTFGAVRGLKLRTGFFRLGFDRNGGRNRFRRCGHRLRHGGRGNWGLIRSLCRSDAGDSRLNRRGGNFRRNYDGGGNGCCNSCCGGRLSLADNRGSGRLDDQGDGGRRNNDCRARRGLSANGSLGNHSAQRRTRGNGRRGRRWSDDGRRGARQWNNAARFRTSRCGGRLRTKNLGRGLRRCWRGRRNHGTLGQMTLPRLGLLLLFLGQDGLQHVTGLGDMREIDFGRNALRGACGL